jgi:MurNAc alpha-1-phosphate uridylyltransferase
MKAFILAAGLGRRLQPLTNSMPKPMLLVAGKPLLQWHLEGLLRANIRQVVINVSWLAEQIEDYFGDGSSFGLNIQWSREVVPLETGGGILTALPLLGDKPFLVINGDVWTDFSFQEIYTRSVNKKTLAHLLMVENPSHNPNGDFSIHQGMAGFEKNRFTFSGISLISPALFNSSQAYPSIFPLRDVLRPAITANRVSADIYSGEWFDIGTVERYDALNKKLGDGLNANT